MAKITTHVLNSLNGTHAAEVDVKIYALGKEIFVGKTDLGGRLNIEIDLLLFNLENEFRIGFDIGSYFKQEKSGSNGVIIKESSLTFYMYDNTSIYHIPIIISPNGCSYWWSGE